MSVQLNKENLFEDNMLKDSQGNIINFPVKQEDNRANLKETKLVISSQNTENNLEHSKENIFVKFKNAIINKFYSVDDDKTKLKPKENDNILNFNLPNKNNNNDSKFPPKPIAITVLGVILLGVVIWGLTYKNAQEVFVDDKSIGIIKTTEDLQTAEDLQKLALDDLAKKEGAKVEVNEKVSFVPVRASKDELISISDAASKVANNFTFKVEASVITVDGTPVATVKNQDEANKILNDVKNKYVNKDVKQAAEPTFVQDVKIENKYVKDTDIINNEDALSALTANKDQGKEYEIKEGDTLFEIAINNDMSLEELLSANPGLTENSLLKIGSKINIIVPTPLLSVVTYEEATYNEVIPKKVETVKNDKEYKTYKKVLTQGKDGSKQVTAKITKVNGVEQKRDVLSEKVIAEPTVEKVEVGTLNTPPKKSIGSFIYPVNGRLSSGYGARWGTTHKGIDLAAPAGTPIKASDGGTVVFSGWNSGGYGYMVKIDHGNGYQTIYAHNTKNAVTKGQKVAQGEVIGYVGSTGNSTGNHVHFEVLKNGVSQNPINYLK